MRILTLKSANLHENVVFSRFSHVDLDFKEPAEDVQVRQRVLREGHRPKDTVSRSAVGGDAQRQQNLIGQVRTDGHVRCEVVLGFADGLSRDFLVRTPSFPNPVNTSVTCSDSSSIITTLPGPRVRDLFNEH